MIPHNPHFTDAQNVVLQAVDNRLGEHFDAFVLVIGTQSHQRDGLEIRDHTYRGGYARALGLVTATQHAMLQPPTNVPPNTDEP